jgi:hypothetical protein
MTGVNNYKILYMRYHEEFKYRRIMQKILKESGNYFKNILNKKEQLVLLILHLNQIVYIEQSKQRYSHNL